jgi:hypothetical protein
MNCVLPQGQSASWQLMNVFADSLFVSLSLSWEEGEEEIARPHAAQALALSPIQFTSVSA